MADGEINWKIFAKSNSYSSEFIGTETDKNWNGDFYFVQGSDPQFGMMDAYRNPFYNPKTANWDEEMRLATLAVEKVNQLNPKPRFFIVCGDQTNEFPGGFPGLKEKQIRDYKKIFSKVRSDIPLICVCGNHDVGDSPTVESIEKYRTDFGDDYFSFWCGGVFFIVLNSQYCKDPRFVPELAVKHEQWLDDQLKQATGSNIVCFSHIPWFTKTPDEKENIYNIPYETRIRILEKLYNAGVRYFFCGHTHANGGAFYKELELIITSAIGMQLGTSKPGLRIVKVSKNNIQHSYHDLENVPSTVSLE